LEAIGLKKMHFSSFLYDKIVARCSQNVAQFFQLQTTKNPDQNRGTLLSNRCMILA